VATELNPPLIGTGSTGGPLTTAQTNSQKNMLNYLWGSGCTT